MKKRCATSPSTVEKTKTIYKASVKPTIRRRLTRSTLQASPSKYVSLMTKVGKRLLFAVSD
jgi:hypothetical protein